MIASQLATCEECRDGSCRRCKNWLRRQKRRYPHATKSHAALKAAMKAGVPVVEVRLAALSEGDLLGLPRVPR